MAAEWFEPAAYFKNKLAALQQENPEYSAEDLLSAFNSAGYSVLPDLSNEGLLASSEELFRHFNEWGNSENISPNSTFNPEYYFQAKYDYLKQDPAYAEWTLDGLKESMKASGVSAWTDYQEWGKEAGISGSGEGAPAEPQPLEEAPEWFQPLDYFANKLDEVRGNEGENYTIQHLIDAFNEAGFEIGGYTDKDIIAAADQLYSHFKQWGNLENVSPNNWFNVEEYFENKLEELHTNPDYNGEYDSWDLQQLKEYFAENNISAWDHYKSAGQFEGINPSAQFDSNAYLQAKADQCNAIDYPFPEEFKDLDPNLFPDGMPAEWTPELVSLAFMIADLNPIEHYMLYGVHEEIEWAPDPETPPAPFAVRELTEKTDKFNDRGLSTDFVATGETLNPDDQITATGQNSELTVKLADNGFDGFSTGFVKGVKSINIDITGNGSFNAEGIDGVSQYNMSGNGALIGLGENVKSVNLSNADGAVMVSMDSSVSEAALSMSLKNVGGGTASDPQAATMLGMNGVGSLSIYSEGKSGNVIDFSRAGDMTTMNIAGSSDIYVTGVGSALTDIDASKASGDVSVNVTNAQELATVHGGQGRNDVLVFGRGASGEVAAQVDGMETVRFANAGNMSINGENIVGVKNIEFSNQDNSVALDGFAGSIKFNVMKGSGTASGANESTGSLTMSGVTSVAVNVENGASFNGNISAENAARMTVAGQGDFALSGMGDLSSLSTISVSGSGNVDLSANTAIGAKSQSIFLQAGSSKGLVTADFQGSEDTQNLLVHGGGQGTIDITANAKNFDYIQIDGGRGDDSVTIQAGNGILDGKNLQINLGDGNDTLTILGWNGRSDLSGIRGVETLITDRALTLAQQNALKDAGVQEFQTVTKNLDGSYTSTASVDDNGVANITPMSGIAGQTINFSGVNDTVTEINVARSDTPVTITNLNPTASDFSIMTASDLTIKPAASATFGADAVNLDVTLENGADFSVDVSAINGGKAGWIVNPDNLAFEGRGNVSINAQVGKGVTDVTIDTTALDGSFTQGGDNNLAIWAKSMEYLGGDGDDSFGSLIFNDSTYDLGNGDNSMALLFGYADTVDGGATRVLGVDITLGQAGGGTDTVLLQGTNQTGLTPTQGAGAHIVINNFEVGVDNIGSSIEWDASKAGSGKFAAISTSPTNDSAVNLAKGDMAQLLDNFGIETAGQTLEFSQIAVNADGTMADVALVGGHAYAIWASAGGSLAAASSDTEGSVALQGIAVVDIADAIIAA